MIDYLSFTDQLDDLILAVIKSCKGEKSNHMIVVFKNPLEARPAMLMLDHHNSPTN